MVYENAIADFPRYMAMDNDVRIYRSAPAKRTEYRGNGNGDGNGKARERAPKHSIPVPEKMWTFWKKHAILAALCIALPLYTFGTCGITASIVRRNTEVEVTERVTHEMRGQFQAYMDTQEQEAAAARFLSGDASLQAAMDVEADSLARLLYGYRNNSLRDRKTLVWCVLARVDSNAYPGTVEGVVNQAQQWMFYSDSNPIREDDRQLALEQLKAWHAGTYPAGLSTEFVYAEWSQSDIALRNEYQTSNKTAWWRMPENG